MKTPHSLQEFFHNKPLRKAAVLVLCYEDCREDYLVLTRRTEEVEHHKGQISFPGGAFDSEDETLWHTALRETQEEIGVDPNSITLVKELESRITPTGFEVTPFVGRVPSPVDWQSNPYEIAEVFTIPFTHLKSPANLKWIKRQMHGVEYLDPLFSYHHYEIWGLTGRIICEFFGHDFPEGAL